MLGRPCRRSVECLGTQGTPFSADLIVDILVRYEMHLGKSLVVPGVTRDFTYSSGWSRTGQGDERDEPDPDGVFHRAFVFSVRAHRAGKATVIAELRERSPAVHTSGRGSGVWNRSCIRTRSK